jgi:hypothetical protein
MVMLLLAYMVMLIAISAGAVGADVCQLYAETKNGNVAPAFERLLDRLGQNCTTFTDAYPQLETVRHTTPQRLSQFLVPHHLHEFTKRLQAYNTTLVETCVDYLAFCSTCNCAGACRPCGNANDVANLTTVVRPTPRWTPGRWRY